MFMNKRVLMLTPLIGLLLTSCGRQWKEIKEDEFFKMRDDIVNNISLPDSFKIYYEGNQATILGEAIKNLGPKSTYDINKKFYQTNANYSMKPVYYVPKNNHLWLLNYDQSDNKTKEEFTDVIENEFASRCVAPAKSALTAGFSYSSFITYLNILKLANETKTEGSVEYKFYSSGKDSIKFLYKFNQAVFDLPTSKSHNDTTKFTGGEEYVIENGLPSYIKCYGNTIQDITAYVTTGELTQTSFTLRYQHNCKIDIPMEANPDTWCD